MLVAVTALVSPASAQEIAGTPRRSDGSTVKDLVRAGQRARAAGKWTEAHGAYKRALEAAEPSSTTERERAEIAGELGLCALRLRSYRDAAEHLAWSLEQREALPVSLQLRFEAGLRKATAHVATLLLAIDPPDAAVVVDGKPVGRIARTHMLFVEAGERMVRAGAPGREESLHMFTAIPGQQHKMVIQLSRSSGSTKEVAEGAPKETPKALSATLPVRSQAPSPPPSPWASWPGTLRVAGIAVTTATVSAGSLLMIRASRLDGDLSERRDGLARDPTTSTSMCWQAPQRAACAELRSLRDERNLSAVAGTVLVIAGGVLGAATAASFFTDFSFLGRTPAQERIHVSPVVTGHGMGVEIGGLW
ncbi:tetratricopeptide repeat protein [Sorangium sp. So ce854]|uniref:tetratricopeptide repeat protein n=1 Tax=Sorangium sp. So ce854 TaxID=3133322 RepID=UPI003F62F1FB